MNNLKKIRNRNLKISFVTVNECHYQKSEKPGYLIKLLEVIGRSGGIGLIMVTFSLGVNLFSHLPVLRGGSSDINN